MPLASAAVANSQPLHAVMEVCVRLFAYLSPVAGLGSFEWGGATESSDFRSTKQVKDGPQPPKTAQKVIVLHAFGVQAGLKA